MATDAIREAMTRYRELAEQSGDCGFSFQHGGEFDATAHYLADWLVANAVELVRAKGLMWQRHSNESWHSPTPFGSANVWANEDGSNDFCWSMDRSMGYCESVADGKSKVESAYRARLAAALEPLFGESGK